MRGPGCKSFPKGRWNHAHRSDPATSNVARLTLASSATPSPAKPEATIIKGAISPEFESVQESSAGEPEATTSVAEAKPQATLEDKPKPEQKPKAKHKDSPKAMPEGHTQAKPDVDPQPQVEDDWGEGIL